MSRLPEARLRRELLHMLGLAAVAVLPLAAFMVILQQPISHLFYGAKYPSMLDGFNALAVGVSLYGFYLVLASAWGALGRPMVGAAATACGTVVTVAAGFLLMLSMKTVPLRAPKTTG